MEVKILNEVGVDFSKVRFDAQVLSTQCVCKFQCEVSHGKTGQMGSMSVGDVKQVTVLGFDNTSKRVVCSVVGDTPPNDVFFFSTSSMQRENLDETSS